MSQPSRSPVLLAAVAFALGILPSPAALSDEIFLKFEVTMSDFVQLEHQGNPVDGGGIASPYDPIVVRFTVRHDFDTALPSAEGPPTITGHQLITTPPHGRSPTFNIDYSPGENGLEDPTNYLYYNGGFDVEAGTLEYTLGFFVHDLGGDPYFHNIQFRDWTDVGGGLGLSSLWVPNEATVTVTVVEGGDDATAPTTPNANEVERQRLTRAAKKFQKQIKALKGKIKAARKKGQKVKIRKQQAKMRKLTRKLRTARNQLRAL